jgi:hypothetical protein
MSSGGLQCAEAAAWSRPAAASRRHVAASAAAASSQQQSLTITTPDDWHLHVRDGDNMRSVVPHTAAHFARAIIMPNLVPPVTNTQLVRHTHGHSSSSSSSSSTTISSRSSSSVVSVFGGDVQQHVLRVWSYT